MESEGMNPTEIINYKTPEGLEVEVPVYRGPIQEVFLALRPPTAQPYVMAPRGMETQQIADFFGKHVAELEELRQDMLKRFAKGSYGKCRYQTGDVAYVMGRPFQLRVYPLGQRKMKSAARGRATSKYSVNRDVSLIKLFVVHPKNYDEAKLAFTSYASSIVLFNAKKMTESLAKSIAPDAKLPAVRIRSMRGRWSACEAGALWISDSIIPYPPECLAFTVAKELQGLSNLSDEEFQTVLDRVVPNWREAAKILSERAEPYSMQ